MGGLIVSTVMVTAGAGIIGVALTQLMRGRIRGYAFASDLLVGAGVALAFLPDKAAGTAVTGVMWAAMALLMSGSILRLRGMRDRESRQLPPKGRPHDNSLDRRS